MPHVPAWLIRESWTHNRRGKRQTTALRSFGLIDDLANAATGQPEHLRNNG